MPRTRRQVSSKIAVPDTPGSSEANGRATRRSTRRTKAEANAVETDNVEVKTEGNDSDDDEEENKKVFVLDGEEFTSYQDFVAAKRKRNQAVLMKLGFGSSGDSSSNSKRLKIGPDVSNGATKRGIRSNRKKATHTAPVVRSRRSSRISGDRTKLVALNMYVNDTELDKNPTVVTTEDGNDGDNKENEEDRTQTYFKGRVNDGSPLTLKDAIEMNEPKWIHDDSENIAKNLLKELGNKKDLASTKESSMRSNSKGSARAGSKSPTSVVSPWENELTEKIEALSIDKEEWVCKVTPDRIFSVATHPSESKLICCAGDKRGYVGLWDVDGVSSTSKEEKDNTGIVSLFRVHSCPINCLEWLNNENMVTSSYDGSVRRLNVETGTFDEIFATYDESDTTYLEDLGYGLDEGKRYWTQSVTTDHRYKGSANPCLFVSTSVGHVFHVDLRVSEKQKITFHETVSEKKVNTVR